MFDGLINIKTLEGCALSGDTAPPAFIRELPIKAKTRPVSPFVFLFFCFADCALCLDAVTTVEIPARILLLRRGPGAQKPAAPNSPPCSQESGTM